MGQSEHDDWESSLHEDDTKVFTVQDGAWFRFESRKLALAIYTLFSDPDSAAISAYRPFLLYLHGIQEYEDGPTPRGRTMDIKHPAPPGREG